jgi:hypothetical protein
MFTVTDRERLRGRALELAAADARVVAGAGVGSLALSEGDRWSDLDLSFAVADSASLADVLTDWTRHIGQEFDAAQLFDLAAGASVYRVFLLPGCLQFDLSFTPASQFGATGPKFKLLFGSAIDKPHLQPTPANELFGYAVHPAVRARICIERGRCWQSTTGSAVRAITPSVWLVAFAGCRPFTVAALTICRPRCVKTFLGRCRFSLQPNDLLTALRAAIDGLLLEAAGLGDFATRVEPRLRELLQA